MNGSENTTLVFFRFYFCQIITIKSVVFSEPCIPGIEHYEAIYSNDLTKIERKEKSVVFSDPFISEIENYEAIYCNDLTKIERKKAIRDEWL
jgi:hypothetical protein